jgi:hypothetical protein
VKASIRGTTIAPRIRLNPTVEALRSGDVASFERLLDTSPGLLVEMT